MHLDGFFFNCLIQEIGPRLTGSRVEDIYDTEDGNLVLQFRAPGYTLRLEISVQSPPFGFFISEQGKRRKSAGVFSQTLKKHILGLFCTAVHNSPFERSGLLEFAEAPAAPADKFLSIEIMGRQNDVILCQDRIVLASTRPSIRGGIRSLQPGDLFILPPAPGKLLPQDVSASILHTLYANSGSPAEKALVQSVHGLSPLLSREICFRAGLAPDSPARDLSPENLDKLSREIMALAAASREKAPAPKVYEKSGPYWVELRHLSEQQKQFDSLSSALAYWNEFTRGSSAVASRKTSLQAALSVGAQKLQRTMAKQELELERARDFERLRQIGDTLLASISSIPKGASSVNLVNVHTGQTVEIALDPEKTPSVNASRYFKKYTKYKNAVAKVKLQIEANHNQLEYLKSLEYAVESSSTPADLEEVMEEMEDQGIIKKHTKRKSRPQPRENFMSYRTPGGDLVLAGRNNKQNEMLTLRKAEKNHFWLHTRYSPGSHVILCTSNPHDSSLEYAAALAAWHSKARSAPKVEVVWTQVKNVKKIPGSKPGMVQYSDYRSALIEPRQPEGGAKSPETPPGVQPSR